MKNLTTKTVLLSSITFFLIAGIIYSLLTPNIYSSKSQVALFRIKVENPDSGSDESRNRWIWIRDGLNLKSAIITDSIIDTVIQKDPMTKEISTQFQNRQLLSEHLKKFVDIQFTGADENNFIVEVKAPTAKLAYLLNSLIFERIKYLATAADQRNFENLIKEIKQKQRELKSDKESFSYYNDKIRKLTFNHIVEQKQRETAFEVVTAPMLNKVPIWPRYQSIIALFLAMGLLVGIGTDYLLKNSKK